MENKTKEESQSGQTTGSANKIITESDRSFDPACPWTISSFCVLHPGSCARSYRLCVVAPQPLAEDHPDSLAFARRDRRQSHPPCDHWTVCDSSPWRRTTLAERNLT